MWDGLSMAQYPLILITALLQLAGFTLGVQRAFQMKG